MKSDLLNGILAVVSNVCEIPADKIISKCKKNEVVDARCMFVHYCNKYRFQAGDIACFLNRNRLHFVNDCLRNHESFSKQSISYRLLCHDVGRILDGKFDETQR